MWFISMGHKDTSAQVSFSASGFDVARNSPSNIEFSRLLPTHRIYGGDSKEVNDASSENWNLTGQLGRRQPAGLC